MDATINFDLIRIGQKEWIADPTCVVIDGTVNMVFLESFLNDEDENFQHIGGDINEGDRCEVSLKVYTDSDDFKTWVDYDILNIES